MCRFSPIDSGRKCRVYFLFAAPDGGKYVTYYDRDKRIPAEKIQEEARDNAKEIRKRNHLKKLIAIYIAEDEKRRKEIEETL